MNGNALNGQLRCIRGEVVGENDPLHRQQKQTVDNNAALAGAIPADELNSLKELVGLATPYTYEELDYTEKELKKQLNLLKTLLANDDKDAIPEVIEDVKSVLASRENQIADVEKAQK